MTIDTLATGRPEGIGIGIASGHGTESAIEIIETGAEIVRDHESGSLKGATIGESWSYHVYEVESNMA